MQCLKFHASYKYKPFHVKRVFYLTEGRGLQSISNIVDSSTSVTRPIVVSPTLLWSWKPLRNPWNFSFINRFVVYVKLDLRTKHEHISDFSVFKEQKMCLIPASLSDWNDLANLSRLANVCFFWHVHFWIQKYYTLFAGFVWGGWCQDVYRSVYTSPVFIVYGLRCAFCVYHLGHHFTASSIKSLLYTFNVGYIFLPMLSSFQFMMLIYVLAVTKDI